jgi:3-phenylpropionate/trans-cinnamate dioxygenase ferredoxin subunit
MAQASAGVPASVVVDVGDLAPGAILPVACGRRKALLCNVEGVLYAVAERCTHAAFSLAEGCLDGPHLECPLHGALFDVRDGSPVRRPASKPLATYPVEVDGSRAEVRFE